MKIWKIMIGLGLGALALAAAALFALPAVVQAQTATPTPSTDGATRPGRGEGFGPRGQHGPGRHGQGNFIEAAASVTGLTADEVRTQLQSGQSLAQIAEAEDKSVADVIAAARALLEEQYAQAVTAGRLTQAEADAKLEQFDETAEQLMNEATLGQGRHGCPNNAPSPAPATPDNTVQPLQAAPGGEA
jgi:hypothetical protein